MTHDRSIRQRQPACRSGSRFVEWACDLMLFAAIGSHVILKRPLLVPCLSLLILYELPSGTMAMLVDLLGLEQPVRSGFRQHEGTIGSLAKSQPGLSGTVHFTKFSPLCAGPWYIFTILYYLCDNLFADSCGVLQ